MGLVESAGRLYFYRSVRRGGRVTSEYVASNRWGMASYYAEEARLKRETRIIEGYELRAWRESLDGAGREVARIVRASWWTVVALLEAAGYHRHKGQWRKRRGWEMKRNRRRRLSRLRRLRARLF